MKPEVHIAINMTKRVVSKRVKKALLEAGMIKELMLFSDYAELCGSKKVGQRDMLDLALDYVDLYKLNKGKNKVQITHKDI